LRGLTVNKRPAEICQKKMEDFPGKTEGTLPLRSVLLLNNPQNRWGNEFFNENMKFLHVEKSPLATL
jgi:hypothetical protein